METGTGPETRRGEVKRGDRIWGESEMEIGIVRRSHWIDLGQRC